MGIEAVTESSAQRSALGGQKDKLIDDIGAVMADAEELLKKARTSGADGYSAARAQLEQRLAGSVQRLQQVQRELKSRARFAVTATNDYAHDNPWKSMGYVALASLVLGLLIKRGR